MIGEKFSTVLLEVKNKIVCVGAVAWDFLILWCLYDNACVTVG